ncbi:hypothetical protein G6F64_015494 [Rhizopus arrhizus]|uniref:Uncharacterized protein n=1 Tax=Rhizopus oryzae TaxID=64495 RepID=A0A9P6WRY6_RHIOR|nr:hypothetical protein G6F64_015494 [Rhizopus arrhizus]
MKRDGRVPTYVMAAQAYDSVKLIAAAMEQAKSTDGAAVQAALEQLQPRSPVGQGLPPGALDRRQGRDG